MTDTPVSPPSLRVSHEARPGLRLTVSDEFCDAPEHFSENLPPMLYYGFMAQGETSHMQIDRRIEASVRPCRPMLLALGDSTRCVGRETPGARYVKFGLSIEFAFMERLAESYAFEDLQRLHGRLQDVFACWSLTGSATAQAVIAEFAALPRHEGLTRLWLEASALRLVAEICAMTLKDGESERFSELNPQEIQRARRLRDLIEENLAAPLSLSELSRELGVNPTTMAAQFKKLYGQPIFAYLREQRLQKARSWLRARDRSVAQVGYAVGFESPAAFSTAYRRRFGHAPSEARAF